MAKKTPQINSGSTADISFLLLTFFLLTSSIDTDQGIVRRLPPPIPPDAKPPEVKDRNVMPVLVNMFDGVGVKGEPIDVRDLRRMTKEFISNPYNNPKLSEQTEKEIPYLGTVRVSKGVISLQNDHGTSYEMYIKIQNELAAAFNELRDDLSKQHFGVPFAQLRNEDLKESITKAIPIAISEAEPKDVKGGSK